MSEQLRIVVDGLERTFTPSEALRESKRLAGLESEAETTLLARRVKLGAFLLQVRAQLPHGRWYPWLGSTDINQKTANMAMKLAGELADGQGELSTDRLFNCLHAIDPATYPDRDEFDAGRVSLIDAERATGARSAANRNARSDLSGAREYAKGNSGSLLSDAPPPQGELLPEDFEGDPAEFFARGVELDQDGGGSDGFEADEAAAPTTVEARRGAAGILSQPGARPQGGRGVEVAPALGGNGEANPPLPRGRRRDVVGQIALQYEYVEDRCARLAAMMKSGSLDADSAAELVRAIDAVMQRHGHWNGEAA